MAIQNFLSGGYYGKLGATVGQRWKNKRTIRTYVVPANPRTPTQQANRGKFADAVVFAQMGMQMNYYCTLFDDPNFTKWNYRMKTARELKNAGLSELDLIPLYPLSFNPPTLLTNFTAVAVSGGKRVTFSAPELSLETDRVLSIMFALYDNQNTFLGYKLYLGYYYATNKGFVEVEMDSAAEINNNCYVRIISNDDENSVTDMIASPRLQVLGNPIDVHAFDKTIVSIESSSENLTITFKEPWLGVPTTNEISFDLECISSGKRVVLKGENLQLFDNNGYCSVILPNVIQDNSELPAFTNDCGLRNLNVNYQGSTWSVTIDGASENYAETNPERNIGFAPIFNSSSAGDITFKIKFNGNISEQSKTFNMICSGRLSDNSEVAQEFQITSDGEHLSFVCVGDYKQYPMMNENDCIKLTNISITCEGVIYNIAAQTIKLRNAIKASYYLESLSWSFTRDGGGDMGYSLEYLQMDAYAEDTSHADISTTDSPAFSYVEIIKEQQNCVPSSSWREYIQDGSGMILSFRDNYSESANNDKTKETSNVILASVPSIVIDGITYTFSYNWMSQNMPKVLSGWEA